MATLNKKLIDLLNLDMDDVVSNALEYLDFTRLNKSIVNSLESLLLPYFPDANIYTFGSKEVGVALELSDLDVYIDTDDTYNVLGIEKNITKRLKQVEGILSKSSQWCDIQVIQEKFPIIYAYHKRIGTYCDISFADGLDRSTSELIEFFCEFQPILRDMVVFLKIWLEKAELSNYITNYTLTLLIINFLQHKRFFPPVKALQAGISQPDRIGPWNVDFDRESIDCFDLYTDDDLESLTIAFFKFFSFAKKFDYVICPYLGVLAPKSYFTQKYINPFKAYYTFANKYNDEAFPFTPMKVQSPFNLAENSAEHVTANQLQRFVDLCGESYSFLSHEADDEESTDYISDSSDY